MEIITGVERRRRWRPEEKLRILAELDEPGAKFAEFVRRHDLSRGLLWQWRDARRRGHLVDATRVFVPLRIAPQSPVPEPRPADVPAAGRASERPAEDHAGRIEIALPDGTVVRVAEAIGVVALRRILAVLRE